TTQVHHDGLVVLRGDDEVLDVEDDRGDVLLDAGDGAELVQRALDADRGARGGGDGGRSGNPHGVADGLLQALLPLLNLVPRSGSGRPTRPLRSAWGAVQ